MPTTKGKEESQGERETRALLKALSDAEEVSGMVTTKKRRKTEENRENEVNVAFAAMRAKAAAGDYLRKEAVDLVRIAKEAACAEVKRRFQCRSMTEFGRSPISEEIRREVGAKLTALDWELVLKDADLLNHQEALIRIEAAAETSELEAGISGMRKAYDNALETNREAYFHGTTPTHIVLSSQSGRSYENLDDYYRVSNEVNICVDPQKTRPGVIAAAYDIDDAAICDSWRSQFAIFAQDVSDDARTHAAFVLDRLKDEVYARACAATSGTLPQPLIPKTDLAELPAVGIDCYTRRAVHIALEFVADVFEDPALIAVGGLANFARNLLLPKLVALPDDNTCSTNDNRSVSASLLTAAMHLFIDPEASNDAKRAAAAVVTAIKFLGSDKSFKVRPKGTAVVALKPVPAHTFVCDYLGETYAPARWLEKLACAKVLGQVNDETAFHNIAMEAPKTDPGGYALYFVDAGGKRANFASSLSHSCEGNVSSSLFVKEDGRLAVALHANRDIQKGEELAYDYSACTTSESEWRSAICLCGAPSCRGSFVELVNLQELRSCFDRAYSPLDGLRALLDGCVYNHKPLPSAAKEKLDRHGFKSHFFGGEKTSSPVWLLRFVSTLVDALEFERGQLPFALVACSTEATRDRAADRARLVLEQRVQSLACAVSVANRLNPGNHEIPLKVLLGQPAMTASAGGILKRLVAAAAAKPDAIWAPLLIEKCQANHLDPRAKLLSIREALLELEIQQKEVSPEIKTAAKRKRSYSLGMSTSRLRACADALLLAAHTKTVVSVERRQEIESEPIIMPNGESAQRKYGAFAQVEAALRWHDVDDLGDPTLGSGVLLARDLAGAALLPDPSAILLAADAQQGPTSSSATTTQASAKNKKKATTKQTIYSSNTLAALVADPERRTRSWLCDDILRDTFLFADAGFGGSEYVDFLGSPALDAVLGDNSSLDAVLAALAHLSPSTPQTGTIKRKKKASETNENRPKDPDGIRALADALPDRAPSHWVACDECGKWRAVPWHHASDYDDPGASFVCADQKKWGLDQANCEEAEAFFGNDDVVVASNEVLDEQCTSVGSKIDALCLKTNVWFDAKVVDSRPLADIELEENTKNHQVSPSRINNAFGPTPISPQPQTDDPELQIKPKKVRIHFSRWAARYDEWFLLPRDLYRLAPHRTFSTVNEEAQSRARGHKKTKSKSRKKAKSATPTLTST